MAFAVAEAGLMLLFFLSSSLTFAGKCGILLGLDQSDLN